MKQKILNLTLLLFCMIVGIGSAWGEELKVDFESISTNYSDWSFSNMTSQATNSNVKAHGGSYFGTTGGRETASITTTNKIANPNSISFYVSKQTTNTTNSSWYVQVSEDNINWTNVKTQSATSMDRGTWVEVKQSLTNYSNVYVRVYYKGTTAVRCIDDLTLITETNGGGSLETKYSVSFKSNIDDNGIVTSDKASAAVGEIVTLTAKPNDGYEVQEWCLTNAGGFDGKFETTVISDTQISFKMKNFDMEYYAIFKESVPSIIVTSPIFTIEGGTYSSPQNVTINAPGASYIYYTICDDDIAEMNGVCIEGESGSVTISNSCTLKAIAFDEALNASEITTATYTIPVARTITWSVNGETTTQTVNNGDKITFEKPSITSIYGKTFVGWVDERISGTTDEVPAFVTSATVSDDITYYAVFANFTDSDRTLKKVISIDDITDGNYALICYNANIYVPNDLSSSACPKVKEYSNTNNEIHIEDNMLWAVTGNNEDGYTFESATNVDGKILKLWGGSANDGTRVNNTSNKNGATDKWFVYETEDYGIILYNKATDAKRYLATYGDNDWRNYTTLNATQRPANLYKVVGGVSYSNYCTTVTKSLKITLNSACTDGQFVYGTYSNSSAFVVPKDLVVSEISIKDNNTLDVKPYNTGDVVPANTGVMVSALEGGDYTVTLSNEVGTSILGDSNYLHPSSEPMTGDNLFYRLTMHNGTQIGYWWGAENGAAFNLAANKAYLAVPKSASVKSNLWFGGVETSISAPAALNADNGVIYNLNGQRVSSATKGIYIKNGKKYFVK